jgi:hypothetical protein
MERKPSYERALNKKTNLTRRPISMSIMHGETLLPYGILRYANLRLLGTHFHCCITLHHTTSLVNQHNIRSHPVHANYNPLSDSPRMCIRFPSRSRLSESTKGRVIVQDSGTSYASFRVSQPVAWWWNQPSTTGHLFGAPFSYYCYTSDASWSIIIDHY